MAVSFQHQLALDGKCRAALICSHSCPVDHSTLAVQSPGFMPQHTLASAAPKLPTAAPVSFPFSRARQAASRVSSSTASLSLRRRPIRLEPQPRRQNSCCSRTYVVGYLKFHEPHPCNLARDSSCTRWFPFFSSKEGHGREGYKEL